jgi:DNA-binding CsgD family transcriptional regulator
MSYWKDILRILGFSSAERTFHFDQDTLVSLQELAKREQRSQTEVAADLITYALRRQEDAERYTHCWRTLSPREQQITALICLNQTNQEIASKLGISPETVKTHVRNVLHKFSVRRKTELRQLLVNWDFSAWQ